MMHKPSRTEQRAGFDQHIRVTLLETDIDGFEGAVSEIKGTISKLTWAVVGAALALTTSGLTLAISIANASGGTP